MDLRVEVHSTVIYSWGKNHRHSLDGSLVGFHSRFKHSSEQKNPTLTNDGTPAFQHVDYYFIYLANLAHTRVRMC
jgi:hypothetical protein